MKQIPLTQGKFAIVDDADFEQLSKYKWCAKRGYATYYAGRYIKKNNKKTTIRMHQEIMNAQKGQQFDHRNSNGLDNRRENLRICTGTQNQANRGKQRNCKSGFKGVSWSKDHCRWQVMIRVNKNRIFLGRFDNKENAARTYDVAAKQYFGEFARLNFTAPVKTDTAVAV